MSDNDTILYQLKKMDDRFDKVDNTLNTVQAAIVQMARTEERVEILLKQNSVLFSELKEIKQRVTDLEKENAGQTKSICFFERTGWLLATTMAGVLSWKWK